MKLPSLKYNLLQDTLLKKELSPTVFPEWRTKPTFIEFSNRTLANNDKKKPHEKIKSDALYWTDVRGGWGKNTNYLISSLHFLPADIFSFTNCWTSIH